MNPLVLVAATLCTSLFLDWTWWFWSRSVDTQKQEEAAVMLKKQGMTAYTYLPSFGVEDSALCEALAWFDFSGQLVLDRDGNLVGRVLPKMERTGPGLRLVVDNTKR